MTQSRNKREGYYWGVRGELWCDLYGKYWIDAKKHVRCRDPKFSLRKYFKETK